MSAVKTSVAVLATHPIQYHAPIFRMLAARDDITLKVFFASDMSVKGYKDFGGVRVKWDIPLLEGYESTFLDGHSRLGNVIGFFKHDRPGIYRALRKSEFDALIIFSNYSMLLTLRAIAAARGNNIPILIRGDNNDGVGIKRLWLKEIVRGIFLKALYSRIAGFLSVGEYMRRHFAAHGAAKTNIFSSPHCIDDVRFDAQRVELSSRRSEIRRKLGFHGDQFVFLYVGKLSLKKNTLLIPAALDQIADNSLTGLLVVGDGEDRAELEGGARRVLRERAVFAGFRNQTELAEYYTASDALILCSSFGESWGLVVNEAQLFGLPVIVSDKVGCREDLVTDNETGLIFPAGDAAALAECMRRLLTDGKFAKRLGDKGRERSRNYRVADAVAGIVRAVHHVTRAKYEETRTE